MAIALACISAAAAAPAEEYRGKYVSGSGDIAYLRLLDTAALMMRPNPELQSLSMLYTPWWNGFVEGPTWDAWWIQNSLGTSYAALPFLDEPYATFLRNSNELWFLKQADGTRKDQNGYAAPDGCLCDAANPSLVYYRQGDGRVPIHDWCVGFTVGGIIVEAERLLVARDLAQTTARLPGLERAAAFVESRRDRANDLFMAGPAGNLLAPSYAGWKRPDATYGRAYLAEISVNYIAALDRLIEVERMANRPDRVSLYTHHRDGARRGLAQLMTPQGYFVKSIDPDGTRHGVYGAPQHGYFEAVVNHDAVAFEVVDATQSQRICDAMADVPGLRPHGVVITNYPSLDDQYEDQGLFTFGPWVNGGHWTTCEARMILAYFRTGRYADARRSMEHILGFARRFRMDNPLTECGAAVYQPGQPINTVYDSWGAPAAMLRGLLGIRYTADGLTIRPQIPPGITRLELGLPVWLGARRIYVTIEGEGPITGVRVNGRAWRAVTADTVTLDERLLPKAARVTVLRGCARARRPVARPPAGDAVVPPPGDPHWDLSRTATAGLGNGLPLRIGADTLGGSRFHGLIRRVRLWTRPMTDAEVAALAADPAAPTPGGVRADWRLGDLKDGVLPNAASGELKASAAGTLAVEGDGVRFDGRGYLEVPVQPALGLGDAYTLDAWVLPDTTSGRIVDRAVVGGTAGYMLDTHPGNALRLVSDQGSLSAAVRLEPGKWVHVAATVDGGGELRLYVDGRKVASAPGKPAPVADGADPRLLARVGAFWTAMRRAGLAETYEARHAHLVLESAEAAQARAGMREDGRIEPLPAASAAAADRLYVETAQRLASGLATVLERQGTTTRAGRLWRAAVQEQRIPR